MRVISAIWIAASLIATPPFARAATPITACGTVITKSGSYVVTKNLTVKQGSTTACIAVNTDYVTIDLGGFTIDCGGEDVLGVNVNSQAGLIVRNVMITRCNIGLAVSALSQTALLVDGLSTISNLGGGMSLGGSGAAVIRSISNDNGIGGIFLQCPANAVDNTALSNLSAPNISPIGSGCNLFNNLAP